ncbi:OmpA family protein [Halalkalibacterium ligniniphilum]|uniref:OmpA family protein n=1 Tax=Halalkalibacterium ligniniphilum TaxID=1134413 RepID=UPI00034D3ADE|nr:OmpA family protein [Halalkalibacterium ligniniphilum]
MIGDHKNKRPDESGSNWLISFADLMMVILVLFIVLLSFSTISQKDLEKAVESFNERPINEYSQSKDAKDKAISKEEQEKLEEMKKQEAKEQEIISYVEAFAKSNGLQNELFAQKTSRGIELVLPERLLFESGHAYLLNEAKMFLSEISPMLSGMENQIIVEGHTDNIPISNESYESNWYLSTARSISVINYLTETKMLEASRFTAVGYGEYKPVADNKTEDGRKKNRRVVILLANVNE